MGNLGVLRGSHFAMQEFFATQDAAGGPMGPGGPFWPREDFNAPNGHGVHHYPDYVREAAAGTEGAEYTIDGKVWPKPTQVLLHPGDAAVVLYHVPHNATRNMSDEVMDGRYPGRPPSSMYVVGTRRFLMHLLWHLGWHEGHIYYHRLGGGAESL